MSVKAKELRMGNYLQHSGSCKPYMVTLERFFIEYETADAFYYLEPIPLTEEILLKCGFEKFRESINWSDWKLGDYRFHFRPKKDCANCFGIQIAGSSGHNITYFNWNINSVHELQNLYFSLTGQEIGVNF